MGQSDKSQKHSWRWLMAAVVTCVALIAASPGHAESPAQPTDPAAGAAPASARQVTALHTGWRFRFGDLPQSVIGSDFDDSGWEAVTLPHTWNRMGNYAAERAAGTDVQQGVGWYRLRLPDPALAPGKRAFLQFDGVGSIADLWVNGAHVGSHKGAFSRFRFDITDHLISGKVNLLTLRADNSKPAQGSTTQHVIPLGGDFFIHGGLYRGVSLIVTDAAAIDLMDHGGPGIYVSTPTVTAGKADVSVLARLHNAGGKPRKLTMVTRIADDRGVTMAQARARVRLTGGERREMTTPLALTNPRLWQGRADPYLYTVTVELHDGRRVIDSVTEPFGVRSFAFDPAQGFVLNGTPMRLHGASRHQDWQDKGWALTPEDHATDMAIMAEMGVNTVRHAHYQHAQEWTELANRYGMVVKAELPFVHQSAFDEGLPAPELIANARLQLIELIRQNYNHPSIMLWSVGNEIDIGAAIAALQKGGKGAPAKSRAMLEDLHLLARQEDPTRPTAYADCCEAVPSPLNRPGAEVLNDVADVIGLNRYFGWYYGQPQDLLTALPALRTRYPDRALTVTEYGAGGAFSQHTDNPLGGPVNANGRPHPEEYQAWVHEQSWQALDQAGFLAGTWIWNMFDFASTSREEGEAYDLNDKGLVSYDRKTRKDAFYFYKANWSDEPVLHLIGRRYADRAYPVVDVRAYSNAPEASLSVNGVDRGTVACPRRICVWPGIRLQPGDNVVTATARAGEARLSDELRWHAPDAAAGLHVRAGHLTGLTTSVGLRFGSDNFFTGGRASDLRMAGRNRVAPSNVTGTPDPELYASYRQGTFSYNLPLPDGRWMVTLHLFEPEEDAAKAAARRMDVRANGQAVLTDFNPAAAAGSSLVATVRSFTVTANGGSGVQLDFAGGEGGAVVSAISVVPAQ